MSTNFMSMSGGVSLTSILTPPRGGFPDARALVKFILSAITEVKRGGYDVRFYVTTDIASAIKPILERLGVRFLIVQVGNLKPPYIFFRLDEDEIVVEASDGEEEFVIGKASSYEFIGHLYDILLERLYPYKKRRDREVSDEETEREVLYLDNYIKES